MGHHPLDINWLWLKQTSSQSFKTSKQKLFGDLFHTAVVTVFLADRPTPPVGPVMFDEVHREYMVISWKPPLDSGGIDVSNYIIEKRDTNRDMWTTVTSATTKTTCKVGPNGCSAKIQLAFVSF